MTDVESWARRVIANAPIDETPEDVLRLMREQRFMNRGRWAAYVLRIGEAQRRKAGGRHGE